MVNCETPGDHAAKREPGDGGLIDAAMLRQPQDLPGEHGQARGHVRVGTLPVADQVVGEHPEVAELGQEPLPHVPVEPQAVD